MKSDIILNIFVAKNIFYTFSHPGAKYVDHFVPESGRGIHLAAATIPIIDKYSSRNSLNALLLDACTSNVGVHHGMVRYIEEVSILCIL